MQEFDKNDNPLSPPEPLDFKKLEENLKKTEVDHVRIFRLKKGDTFKLNDHLFEVTKVMSGGRAIIKKRTQG